ncbi:MAG: hypothetical protein DWQ49_09865 [Bacteroidetes bacterium]|nr:MAG: hypothetical protein DWQ49_09865 [Bacteroidota bacterium]
MSKADMIVDLQYGSTGKGLIAGYLAVVRKYDTVITANMPNAGHTFIDTMGNKMVHKVLPNGVVSPRCKWALIGPGAVFDLDQLLDELNHLKNIGYDHFKVGIHPNAVLLKTAHKLSEKNNVSIGSTMQGSGAALIEKIQRDPKKVTIIGQFYALNSGIMYNSKSLNNIVVLSHDEYRHIIEDSLSILLEGAQGFSLGINERFYPYCTSRDCTPARFMADMGIPLPMLREVIGTARTYPIRVGNPPGGYSGSCYNDQMEIKWSDIGIEPELTTVTKRERRLFSFSFKQIRDAMWAMAPDSVFLNFCNYCKNNPTQLELIESAFKGKIVWKGWGPSVDDIKEIKHG